MENRKENQASRINCETLSSFSGKSKNANKPMNVCMNDTYILKKVSIMGAINAFFKLRFTCFSFMHELKGIQTRI